MISKITKFVAASALTLIGAYLIYGQSKYANLGFATIDAKWITFGIPVIVGILYALLGPEVKVPFSQYFGSSEEDVLDALLEIEMQFVDKGDKERLELATKLRNLTLDAMLNEKKS